MTRQAAPSRRAIDLFLDAVELPAEERPAFLAQACADTGEQAAEPELERRVMNLLAAHERAHGELGDADKAHPQGVLTDLFADELQSGASIGPYQLEREIAVGGFGTVWLAQQRAPIRRTVALKVLKPGMDSREVITRFEAERQALAMMDHTNIARVFDGGTTERGRPFFVMEYVEGCPITEYCNSKALDLPGRLELFETVCLAVQHAHKRGIVHRDIKPNNVLVTEIDGRPVPKVIDFGIAKAIGVELTEKTLQTLGDQVIGTPAYMSPEQTGSSTQIDARSDVYSLGVLLYELLSGTTPFARAVRDIASIAATLQSIRSDEPTRPSLRIRSAPDEAPVRERAVRGDLDWIVLRCLEKLPARRYASVKVLANEINRHLRGEPVLAGPPSLSYRLNRYWHRNRGLLVASGLVVLTLTVSTVVAWREANRATKNANRAQSETTRAQSELAKSDAMALFMEHVFAAVAPRITSGEDTGLLRSVLNRAANNVDQFTSNPIAAAVILRKVSGYFMSINEPGLALSTIETCIDTRLEYLGPDDLNTLEAQHWLGDVLLQNGQSERAADVLADCWNRHCEQLGAQDSRSVAVRATQALALTRTHRSPEAVATLREVLERYREEFGDEAESTLRILNNLGGSLETELDHAGAEACFREAYETQRRVHGLNHLPTLKSMTNLARIRMHLGKQTEATELLAEALTAKREMLSPGHPSLLTAIHTYAQALERDGHTNRAAALRGEGLAMAKQHLPAAHPTLLMFHVSNVQGRMRAEDVDADLLAEVLELLPTCQARLGARHEAVSYLDRQVAEIHLNLNRPSEAQAWNERSIRTLASFDDPRSIAAQNVLQLQRGRILHELGEFDLALETLQAGFSRTAPRAGSKSEANWRLAIAATLDALGRTEDAASERERLSQSKSP